MKWKPKQQKDIVKGIKKRKCKRASVGVGIQDSIHRGVCIDSGYKQNFLCELCSSFEAKISGD